VDNWVYITT